MANGGTRRLSTKMRTSANQQRVARFRAVITGDHGKRLGRELDTWLPYWESSFKARTPVEPPTSNTPLTQNQVRLLRLAEILRGSRKFSRLVDGALPHWERCRRTGEGVWWGLKH